MRYFKLLLPIILFFFILNISYAQNITIEPLIKKNYKFNEPINFTYIVKDDFGIMLSDSWVTCSGRIFNEKEIYTLEPKWNTQIPIWTLSHEPINKIGAYNYILFCETPDDEDSISGTVYLTENGENNNDGFFLLIPIISITALIFCLILFSNKINTSVFNLKLSSVLSVISTSFIFIALILTNLLVMIPIYYIQELAPEMKSLLNLFNTALLVSTWATIIYIFIFTILLIINIVLNLRLDKKIKNIENLD